MFAPTESLCIYLHVYSVMSDSLDPMNGSPPGFSVYGIFQAKILEWVPISSNQTVSPALIGRFFTTELPGKPQQNH